MSLEKKYFGDDTSYEDPYCYPGSEVLKNNFDIRDQVRLNSIERAIVSRRLLRLHLQQDYGDFSAAHYLELHKFLFNGIYPFAGNIRTVDIIKGSTYFARFQFIEEELRKILFEMQRDMKATTDVETLAKVLAKYYIDLNLLHPFREGNGRVQREFIRECVETVTPSLPFGPVTLDYSRIDKEGMLLGVISGKDLLVEEQLMNGLTSIEKEKTY